jgi:hypothetical protein
MAAKTNASSAWARRVLLFLGGMAAVGAAWAAYDLQTGPGPLQELRLEEDLTLEVPVELSVPLGEPAIA